MAQPKSMSSSPTIPSDFNSPWPTIHVLLLLLSPFLVSNILFHLVQANVAKLPDDHSFSPSVTVPERHDRVLANTERVGDGRLPGPEDLALDSKNGLLYTGCEDGWIRSVKLEGDHEDLNVEDLVFVGGRPVGVATGPDGSLAVAHGQKGLLKVNPDETVELLTDEAEGLKFGLTDGVDVAAGGIIYFTDASYKYSLEMHMLDILEARPHGRLMSFDPATNQTTVLVRDLYFANGVSLSPDQNSLIYCETVLRRCRRYHIQGDKKGTVENFIDNLPGFPDNIRYDGEGRYWIALSAGRTLQWDILFKYPSVRKLVYILEKFVTVPHNLKNSGILSVTLDGEPVSLYTDPGLILATSGLKIGKYLYYGSLIKSYISRIDLTKSAANAN